MNELIFLVEEAPEGGYVAQALGAAIFTEAEIFWNDLRREVCDAVHCHFDDGHEPTTLRLHLVERVHLVRDEVIGL